LCVGEIEQMQIHEGDPLIFFRGGYGRFEPAS
jgi:hypothetical protein